MLLFPFLLLLASGANAATPVYGGSFDGAEKHWTVVHGSAALDASVLHEGHKSIRLERDAISQDACVRLAPVTLTIGKRYELSGWVRTENLEVRDLDRTPIAIGAALGDGIHAFRRAFGVLGRNSAMDPRLPQVRGQPQPGPDSADGG